MTPDQLDKAIQFLLEQQAAFEASLQETRQTMHENSEKTDAQIRELSAYIRELSAQIHKMSEDAGRQNQSVWQQINALSEKISAQSEQIHAHTEQINALKDGCRDLLEHAGYTDFRLRRLENPEL